MLSSKGVRLGMAEEVAARRFMPRRRRPSSRPDRDPAGCVGGCCDGLFRCVWGGRDGADEGETGSEHVKTGIAVKKLALLAPDCFLAPISGRTPGLTEGGREACVPGTSGGPGRQPPLSLNEGARAACKAPGP